MDDSGFTSRLRFVGLTLCVVAAVVVVRLAQIQFGPDSLWLRSQARQLDERVKDVIPPRGQIYDRNGELLAVNDTVYEIGFSPRFLRQPDDVPGLLAGFIPLPESKLWEKAHLDPEENVYVVVHPGVTGEVWQGIQAEAEARGVSLDGVEATPRPHRAYPAGTSAAQIVGFVASPDRAGRRAGYYGVEEYYNEILSGQSASAVKHWVPFDVELDPTPPGGQDLVLTIDRDIQFEVERALAEGLAEIGAQGGLIVVMDPQTGELLAMAATPGFDPNRYDEFAPEAYSNPAVSAQYEPGSVFKVLTMSAALDSGTVTPTSPFLDTGVIEVGGAVITNWDGGAWGPQDMLGCMQHSLNVCLAAVGTWMGPKTFYNYMAAFGIGHTTNVDLAGEAAGRLKRPGDPDWYDSDLGTNSFGQGVAVTPVQLITAISAVANGGAMMQPHVLKQVVSDDGLHTTQPQVLGRPIRPETAATLMEMLAASLDREASSALVPGYRIAGKTGTAQIPIPGGYASDGTIASFVGWGPVDDPRFIVLVKLERPTASPWGSTTAAPLFGKLARRLFVLLEVPPDAVRQGLEVAQP